jgi:hypothetical protein
MGRKAKDDDEMHNMSVSNLPKRQPNPSAKKDHESTTIIGQLQQRQMARISLGNLDPLPLPLFNVNGPQSKSLYSVGAGASTTQDAINMATELSVLLLEPRPIEQMSADPLLVDDSFAGMWPTEV